jgi:hypothetical protein
MTAVHLRRIDATRKLRRLPFAGRTLSLFMTRPAWWAGEGGEDD